TRRVRVSAAVANHSSVLGELELLGRALHSRLETAIKFSNPGEMVRVTCATDPESVQVIFESEGKRVPEGAIGKFFDMFGIGESCTPGGDLGLGPATAARI